MKIRCAALLLLLVAGCSLPLPKDVHTVGEVPADSRQGAPLQVIPPGPQAGATPAETVLGFLGAQADADGRHAIARKFLTASFAKDWHDDAGVRVYDADRLSVSTQSSGDPLHAVVRVAYTVTGELRTDGSYLVGSGSRVSEEYDLYFANNEWAIASSPDGLRLTDADRERSFVAQQVFFLATTGSGGTPHLVPDRVFVPTGADRATALVSRLLGGPSQALAGSVSTAVPAGLRLRSGVRVDGTGAFTLDLIGASPPTGPAAEGFAAQLVWTLKELGSTVRAIRVKVENRLLQVRGRSGPLTPEDWDAYDPNPLGSNPPYYFVSRRSPRASGDVGESRSRDPGVIRGQPFPVDAVAVTPDRSRAALLEVLDRRHVTVRVGATGGAAFPVVAQGAVYASLSWGYGDVGLWLVRDRREVVLLARGARAPRAVQVQGLPRGPIQALAVSRDDARVALVVNGRLYIGRVLLTASGPVVVDLVSVLPGLRAARAVAWTTNTEVVVLGVLTQATQLLRVAVDGSSVGTVNSVGLTPTAITGAPNAILVVSAGHLFLGSGGTFRRVQADPAAAPAYPG